LMPTARAKASTVVSVIVESVKLQQSLIMGVDVGATASNNMAATFSTPCQALCQITVAWVGSIAPQRLLRWSRLATLNGVKYLVDGDTTPDIWKARFFDCGLRMTC